MLEALSRRVPTIVLWLVFVQYTFVNLAFSTITMNIVMVKDIAFPFLAVVIFWIWVLGEFSFRGVWELRPSPVNLPIAVMILFLAHSAATSPLPALSVEEFGKFFANFFLLFTVAKFLTDRAWVHRYLWMIAVNAALMTVYGIGQWMGTDLLQEIGRGFRWGFPGWGGQEVFVSTHGNQNFFSGYLVATIPILIGWWLVARRPVLLLGLPPLVAGMLLCVVKGEARGAYLGFIGAMFLFLVGLAANRRNLQIFSDPLRKKMLMTGAAIVLGAGLLTAVVRPETAKKPFETVYRNLYTLVDFETSYTNAVRFVFWQDFIDGGMREPLTGRGLGTSNPQMPASRPNWYHHTGVSHNTMHAHNEWFEWVMEGGLTGTSLYVWINIALFGGWIRTLSRRRADSDFPLLLGIGLGLMSQLVQSCFDPETRWTGNAVTNWFSAGLMIAWANLPPPEDARPSGPWDGAKPASPSPAVPWMTGLALAVIVMFSANALKVWDADYFHRMANAYTEGSANRENLRIGLDNAQKCADLNPYHLSNYYKLAYAHLALQDFESARGSYKDLQYLAPNYAQVHINLSYVEHALGNRYGSAWERDRAAIIEDNTRNHVSAAEYWAMLGRMEHVLPHLRHALKIDQDDDDGSRTQLFYQHDDIHYRLAQALGQVGDVERAMRELENALSRNPGHPQALYQLLQVYYSSGRMNDADSLIASIGAKFPNSELLYLIQSDRAFRAGNLDVALLAAQRLSDFFPWPEPGKGSGNPSINLVAQIAQTSIQRGSNLPVAYALIARAWAAVGDYDKAYGILVEARMMAPQDAWIEGLFAAVASRKPS